MKIGLVACCSSKLETSSKVPAQSLYVSPLFTFSKAYCEKYLDGWFILSAKFGLVSPTELLPMYEESLIGKRERERRRFGLTMLGSNWKLSSAKGVRLSGWLERNIPSILQSLCRMQG